MDSAEIKELIQKHDSRRRGALAPSIEHTVRASDEQTRASLLNALQTARLVEAVGTLTDLLRERLKPIVAQDDPLEEKAVRPKRMNKAKLGSDVP